MRFKELQTARSNVDGAWSSEPRHGLHRPRNMEGGGQDARESTATQGQIGNDDEVPNLILHKKAAGAGVLSLAGQHRVANGEVHEVVLFQERRASTHIATWWRGMSTRHLLPNEEFCDEEGNVVGRRAQHSAVSFGELGATDEDIVFENERTRRAQNRPNWIKLRRVKDEYLKTDENGVTKWSYRYTLDGKQFMSGRSLQYVDAENVVRQGVFIVMSNQVVETLILLCE